MVEGPQLRERDPTHEFALSGMKWATMLAGDYNKTLIPSSALCPCSYDSYDSYDSLHFVVNHASFEVFRCKHGPKDMIKMTWLHVSILGY